MNENGFIYSGFASSQGPSGVYTTVKDNEVVQFRQELGYLYVEARSADLKILLANSPDIWYVPAGMSDEVKGFPIPRMQIMCPAGTSIYWKGYEAIP